MRFNENICRLCGKEFDNLDSLQKHIWSWHR